MEFRILGPLEVRTDDGPIELGPAKPRALLGLLLVHANQAVSAEQLIDDLWEQRPPRSAATALQTYISQLRKRLGPALQTRPTGYLLELETGELDAARFEQQVNETATADVVAPERTKAQLTAALGLWRGTALADFAGAPWAEPETARLEGLRLLAVEDRTEARLALGEHARLVPELESLVAAHPMRERLWAQLMLALYRADRQADALRTYTRLRALLAEELGIDPSGELARLEQAILVHDAELDWRPPVVESVTATAVEEPAGLPSGVVTFLLTDVVGSTQLWDEQPTAMADALPLHEAVIADAVRAHRGRVLKQRGEGDSAFVVFTRATDALAAALDAQRSLRAQAWPMGAELSVRMAIHSGEAMERDGDYFGTTVNRAARLRALAEGGQVLVSQSSVQLLVDHLPDGIGLVELGSHALRGLRRPEHVYAVSSADLPQPAGGGTDRGGTVSVPSALAVPPAEPFVGRTEELAGLEKAWQAARNGERRVVLLAGEPGIGKTRLGAELAQRVHADGGMVLYGRCDDELGVAYQPFTEALRHWAAACSPARLRRGGPGLAQVARLVPELESLLPGLAPPRRADPETERYELFEGVVSVLAALSGLSPVLLVLDDLHWAAKPTLLLLRHLLRATTPVSLLVIGTYRSTEVGRQSLLGQVLPDLRFAPGVEQKSLSGFSFDEVEEYVSAATGNRDDSLELTRVVQRDTRGNPLFVREIVRHLGELIADERPIGVSVGVAPVPQTVRDVMERRIARLSVSARQLLVPAAVLGSTFPVNLLERTVGGEMDSDTVLDALDEVIDAGILSEPLDETDTVEFTHTLMRQTLYTGLSAVRRARMHKRVGETLESGGAVGADDERLPALAYHYAEAARLGCGDQAATYALLAGRQALSLLAFEDAMGLIERGLHALSWGPHHRPTRAELLLTLAEARKYVADRDGARDAARRAAEEARADPGLFASAAISHAWWGRFGDDDVESVRLLSDALALLGDTPTIARAEVLATLGTTLGLQGDPASGRDFAEQAVAMARTLEDPVTLWTALFARSVSLHGSPDVAQRLALTRELMQLGKDAGDVFMYLQALENEQYARVELGDLAGLPRYLVTFSEQTERAKQQSRAQLRLVGPHPWELPLIVTRDQAFLALLRGEWDRAEERILKLGELAGARADLNFTNVFAAQLLWLRREQGRAPEILPAVLDAVASNPLISAFRSAVGLIAVDVDDLGLARQHFTRLTVEECATLQRGILWTATLAMLAEVCVVLGDREQAPVLFDLFQPHAGHLVIVANLAACMGAVDRYLGMLEAIAGDWDAAGAHFEAALELEERIESPPLIARTKYWYGSMLLERQASGDRERARTLLNGALSHATQLGMSLLAAQAHARLMA